MNFKINQCCGTWFTAISVIIGGCKTTARVSKSTESFLTLDGLWIENIDSTNSDVNRYTSENRIYSVGREFVFDYLIVRNDDSLKITAPKSIGVTESPDKTWDFVPFKSVHEDKI